MDEDETETGWGPEDPRWHAYHLGWAAGYKAAEADLKEKMPDRLVDAMVTDRIGALLADARRRAEAERVFGDLPGAAVRAGQG